ncbi:hypothetical protein HDE_03915 [Halotydeus destructor]|nr:hypothetical protein HDE_03915 [Halotydeus destructor]
MITHSSLLIVFVAFLLDNTKGQSTPRPPVSGHDSEEVPWKLCQQPTEGVFCFGSLGNRTDHPAGQGCWKDESCEVAIVGQMGQQDQSADDYNITWNIYYEDSLNKTTKLFTLLYFNKIADNSENDNGNYPSNVPFIKIYQHSGLPTTDPYCASSVSHGGISHSIICSPHVYDYHKHQESYEHGGKKWTWYQFSSKRRIDISYGPSTGNAEYHLDFMTEALQPVFTQRFPATGRWYHRLRTNRIVDIFRYSKTQVTLEPSSSEAPATLSADQNSTDPDSGSTDAGPTGEESTESSGDPPLPPVVPPAGEPSDPKDPNSSGQGDGCDDDAAELVGLEDFNVLSLLLLFIIPLIGFVAYLFLDKLAGQARIIQEPPRQVVGPSVHESRRPGPPRPSKNARNAV